MDREGLIKLTSKLYRLTLFFPKKEPLRYKVREIADNILASFVRLEFSKQRFSFEQEIKKEIEIIKAYLEIAKWQNWVSYFDILDIIERYDKIESDLTETVENKKPVILNQPKIEEVSLNKELNPRKEKILQILKDKERVQVWEIKEALPETSKRTLRRDFEQLLKQGLVERIGERNDTFYKLR